jgi:aspartate-semialdehyde dehydrogenase
VVVSTYQSVTGSGVKAVEQLKSERKGEPLPIEKNAYPHPIDMNCLPHIDVFLENGYTKEEVKVMLETRKIMSINNLNITCTAVRVPVMGGLSESVNITFKNDFDIEEIKSLLSQSPGIKLYDNVNENIYPMPIISHDNDSVWVGRIRRDLYHPKTLNLWIVSDNLRKGAATNAVQILELLVNKGWVN